MPDSKSASWLKDQVTQEPIQLACCLCLCSLLFPPVFPFFCCIACICCCAGKRQARQWARSIVGSPNPKGPPLLLDEVKPQPTAPPAPSASVSCPKYWSAKDTGRDFDERYDLPPKVLKRVQRLFDQTWMTVRTRDRVGPMPLRLAVISAQRVEDREMWTGYADQKKRIKQARRGSCAPLHAPGAAGQVRTFLPSDGSDAGWREELDDGCNEFYLFHGTSPEGARGICEEGFRLDLSGSNTGSMFGRGAYFAECCSKADEYAKEGKGIYAGIYALLLCRVCCGQMHRALRRDDAALEAALRSGQYDGVLGDREASVGTYREFVVYRARQVYPEYVVLYKRVAEEEEDEGEDRDGDSSEASSSSGDDAACWP